VLWGGQIHFWVLCWSAELLSDGLGAAGEHGQLHHINLPLEQN
jgi:hypothetical protein